MWSNTETTTTRTQAYQKTMSSEVIHIQNSCVPRVEARNEKWQTHRVGHVGGPTRRRTLMHRARNSNSRIFASDCRCQNNVIRTGRRRIGYPNLVQILRRYVRTNMIKLWSSAIPQCQHVQLPPILFTKMLCIVRWCLVQVPTFSRTTSS